MYVHYYACIFFKHDCEAKKPHNKISLKIIQSYIQNKETKTIKLRAKGGKASKAGT
jgi:hypothetical protein